MVDLQIQAGKYEEATKSVEYGYANCKEEDMIAFYETQNHIKFLQKRHLLI